MTSNGTNTRTAVGSKGQLPEAGLARDLSELARDLQAQAAPDELLAGITNAAVSEIDGATWAGVAEVVGRRVVTRAATARLVEEVDRLQYRSGDGPCLTSLIDEATVVSNDLGNESRWPGFSAPAFRLGVRSVLAVQLFVADANLGALNIYAEHTGAFGEQDESAAMLLAAHAAVAIKAGAMQDNLRTALGSRDIIGQAKGILMERFKIDAVQAFDLLARCSKSTQRKIRDIADELTLTGELPPSC